MSAEVVPADPATQREVDELVAAATRADGVGPLSEHARLHAARGGGTNLVVLRADGRVAGFAHLDIEDGTAEATGELVVDPEQRRRGFGAALAGALEAAAGPHELRLWAHGGLSGAVALARSRGYRQVRELRQLRRAVAGPGAEPLPDLPALDGLRLRAFRVGEDEQAWLRVNARAFAGHPEQGGWTIADLADREGTSWFDPDGFLLLEVTSDGEDTGDRGDLAGFHWTKLHPQEGRPPLGEVYVVGLDPAYQGRGLGPLLTLAGLHYLRSRGVEEVMLYADAANAPALATYAKLGFATTLVDVMYAAAADQTGDTN